MKEIKKSVTNVQKKVLKTDDKLEKLVIDYAIRKTTGSRKDLNGVYYSKNGKHLLMASKSLSGKYEVCEGTREIDADAFWGCAYLEELIMPESIESIGHEAFGRCISLKEISIPHSVRKMGVNPFIGIHNIHIGSLSENVACDGKAVFTDNGKTLVSFVSDDSEYTVPEGVECIGEKAFSGKRRLQGITMPKSLKVIDDEAFFDCDALLSIVIPESTEYIGECAFGDCLTLRNICFNGVPKKIKRTMLAGCENIRKITIPKDSAVNFRKLTRDFEDRVLEDTTLKPTKAAESPEEQKPSNSFRHSGPNRKNEKTGKDEKNKKKEKTRKEEKTGKKEKNSKTKKNSVPPMYKTK